MPKTVLITGSLGYIGSRLAQHLHGVGFRCLGYDTGFFHDCVLYPPADVETVRKDVRQIDRDDLKGVDVVIHLAGMSNDPFGYLSAEKVYDPTRVYALRLAKLCKDMGIRFIFPSSCSVYGVGKGGLLTEDGETNPQTPYSLNKLQVEGDLRGISDENFSPIILRLATVYGLSPRMRFDVVVNMLTAMAAVNGRIVLNSDGKAWRPHVHIDDVARAMKMCIELEHNSCEPLILNVGDTEENYQVIEVAQMVKGQVQDSEIVFLNQLDSGQGKDDMELVRDRKIQDGADSRTYKVSFERIKQVLPGFQCDWTVRRGIGHMVDRFREMGLTEEHFKDVSFYRLQKMESLLNNGYLSEDLYWIR